jgi:mRNA interferase RelE/StbE
VNYRIEIKPSAADALARIPNPHRRRIARKIDRLAEKPRPRGARALTGGTSLYRIRVGNYRVVYQIQDDALLVLVVRIGSRGDMYQHLP